MKIDNSGSAVGAYASQSKLAKRDAGTQATAAGSAPTDSVEINPLASRISALATQAGDTAPSFDAAKVDAIKSAIAAGSFSVDPGKIADSLIASTKELLNQ
ncbi:flagellar biosynthesis anti-sigma factor FlgM [Aquitalea sp. FJL05]|uniref:flagellar biosynthesis anti-sigma factor FlgM n=1 Tax=Aquitalea sp. FJL05 TaxID=2153366 RepID=UPI000F596255|nr:flagellar biosynthesis anti-sigma factor FlgM [Aquitalea sp. FJL05]RQO76323.1 flagellar biosynthesis anti-sigma factor FlgM [Aquitalea sp. FJL05]